MKNHEISADDVLAAAAVAESPIASQVGPRGTKRLVVTARGYFRVYVGGDQHAETADAHRAALYYNEALPG